MKFELESLVTWVWFRRLSPICWLDDDDFCVLDAPICYWCFLRAVDEREAGRAWNSCSEVTILPKTLLDIGLFDCCYP